MVLVAGDNPTQTKDITVLVADEITTQTGTETAEKDSWLRGKMRSGHYRLELAQVVDVSDGDGVCDHPVDAESLVEAAEGKPSTRAASLEKALADLASSSVEKSLFADIGRKANNDTRGRRHGTTV